MELRCGGGGGEVMVRVFGQQLQQVVVPVKVTRRDVGTAGVNVLEGIDLWVWPWTVLIN